MLTANDLPDTVPLFPLPGALMLPRANLPLHIFEPRYLAMFEDALKTPHRLIGMIQPVEMPGSGKKGLHDIGCAGRVTAFSETEDGRYMLTLTGISRFRMIREIAGFSPYRRAQVTWSGFDADLGRAETDPGFDRDGFFDLLGRYFSEMGLSTDWESLQNAEDELLINSLSMLCPLGPEEKQALLETPHLSDRRETLTTLLQFAIRGGDNEDRLQ
jgi:uncharacterized protein